MGCIPRCHSILNLKTQFVVGNPYRFECDSGNGVSCRGWRNLGSVWSQATDAFTQRSFRNDG